jgi:HNH endonuclease
MGAAVAGPEMAAGDLVGAVLQSVLAEVLSTPWLIGVLLLVIAKVVGLGRAVVHGGHGRDPRRAFSRAEKALLLERAGHRCEHHSRLLGWCRETEALQADHVHPHSRGGVTDIANGQALCRRHNRGKAARVPWGWELARLERRRQACFSPGSVTAVVRHGPRVRSTGVRQIGAVSGARALRNVLVDAD